MGFERLTLFYKGSCEIVRSNRARQNAPIAARVLERPFGAWS